MGPAATTGGTTSISRATAADRAARQGLTGSKMAVGGTATLDPSRFDGFTSGLDGLAVAIPGLRDGSSLLILSTNAFKAYAWRPPPSVAG